MKPWWKSKTLWVNAMVAALAAFEAGTGLLQPLLPANVYAVIAFLLPAINAVLRIVTTQGLK
jgi:NAD(P)H-hydrate repair Nnr-like enzyme with NAD(P)H-hydrate dehydratase domain